jgi:hypothetical protein
VDATRRLKVEVWCAEAICCACHTTFDIPKSLLGVWKSHFVWKLHSSCDNRTLHAEMCIDFKLGRVFWKNERVLAKTYWKIETHACDFHTQPCNFHTFACKFFRHACVLILNVLSSKNIGVRILLIIWFQIFQPLGWVQKHPTRISEAWWMDC